MPRDGQGGCIAVVDSAALAKLNGERTCTADQYLEGVGDTLTSGGVIVNLCRSYQYLSKGYYVSLLADARNQRAFPSLDMIEEINNPFAYFRKLREAGVETIDFKVIRGRHRLLPKVIAPRRDERADGADGGGPLITRQGENGQVRYERTGECFQEATAVFGKSVDERFRRQCAAVFKLYAFPLLRIRFYEEDDTWKVGQIFAASAVDLSPEELSLLSEELSAAKFAARASPAPIRRHSIACLWDPADCTAPSDDETLDKFARVAARHGLLFERIGREDLNRLPEYDALFIRTVTAIDHDSFVFAQRAESLGMPVIDDPQSILRCSNKVYLHELFRKNGIPTPRTLIVSRRTPAEEIQTLGFPLIIKLPDGTFSQSVKKARDTAELKAILQEMFKDSPLVIVQEFAPTPFDWRIGLLDGEVLYACKYHMAKDHWQIVRRFQSGYTRFGKVEAVPIDELRRNQRRIPVISGKVVPEFVPSFREYRRRILRPIYDALAEREGARRLRHEWVNSRGAILRFSRRAIEIRVLDTQECPKMDVAVAVFVRGALRSLVNRLLGGELRLPEHGMLVSDLRAVIGEGSAAQVRAVHLRRGAGAALISARRVLKDLLEDAARGVSSSERPYLGLIEARLRRGSLAESIARAVRRGTARTPRRREMVIRDVYEELADCLWRNTPWEPSLSRR